MDDNKEINKPTIGLKIILSSDNPLLIKYFTSETVSSAAMPSFEKLGVSRITIYGFIILIFVS